MRFYSTMMPTELLMASAAMFTLIAAADSGCTPAEEPTVTVQQPVEAMSLTCSKATIQFDRYTQFKVMRCVNESEVCVYVTMSGSVGVDCYEASVGK